MTSQSLHQRRRTGTRRNPRGASVRVQRRDPSIQLRPGAAPDVRDRRASPLQPGTRQLPPAGAPHARRRHRGDRAPRLRQVRPGPHRAARPHYTRKPALGGSGGHSRGAEAFGCRRGGAWGKKGVPRGVPEQPRTPHSPTSAVPSRPRAPVTRRRRAHIGRAGALSSRASF